MTNYTEMIDRANRLMNSTIKKLDRIEIGLLGLYNLGVMTYKGALKSRKQGWKTEKIDEYQTNFICEHITIEFIKIVAQDETPEYAMRIKSNETGSYDLEVQPIWGVDFFKN